MAWPSLILSIGGKLKEDYIRLNNYFASIKSTYDSHVAGTTDKHSADKITYSGSFTNKQDVNAALDQAKHEIDTIVINASIDPEVALSRESSTKEKTFATLGARLEEAEQDHKTHLAENANNLISSLSKRLQNGEVTKIKLIGDSITEGVGAIGHIYPVPDTQPLIFNNGTEIFHEGDYVCRCWANLFREWVALNYPTVQFVNAGIAGKTVDFALANKQYWVDDVEDVVIVMLGTNDRSFSIGDYKSDLEQFLSYVKSHSKTMVVMTPPPPNDDYDSTGAKRRVMDTADLDKIINEVCVENGYSHISLFRNILAYCRVSGFEVNHISSKYLDAHPNDFGHDLVWHVMQQAFGFSDSKRWMINNQSKFDQLLIDGNFQVAQAVPVVGTEVLNPAYDSYPIFDMWKLDGFVYSGESLPSNIKHSQRKITDSGAAIDSVPGSKYCYRINVDGAGTITNTEYNLEQCIENGVSKYLPGNRILFISFWARASIANKKLQISAYSNYGSGGSPSPTEYALDTNVITLNNNWAKYCTILVMPSIAGKTFGTNGDDFLEIRISLCGKFQNFVGAGDIEITQAQVSLKTSTPFPIKSFDEELIACQAYFEKSYRYQYFIQANANGIDGFSVPSNTIPNYQVYGRVRFAVKKFRAPVVTIYPHITPTNTYQVTNGTRSADLGANSGKPSDIGESGFLVRNENGTAITTTNNFVQFHWLADARRH